MMINMCFKDKDHQCVAADAGGVKKEDFIAVFKDRNFWVFVIFIVGTWSFYNIFDICGLLCSFNAPTILISVKL